MRSQPSPWSRRCSAPQRRNRLPRAPQHRPVGELRFVDGTIFDDGFADVTKSAKRAYSAGGGVDWFLNKNLRVVVDVERTSYTLGAKDGTDRPPETSIVGRVQTVF